MTVEATTAATAWTAGGGPSMFTRVMFTDFSSIKKMEITKSNGMSRTAKILTMALGQAEREGKYYL